MHELPPSPWVQRFAPLIARGGSVLDVACGRGRHARLLAGMGYRVTAVDRDDAAPAVLGGIAQVTPQLIDLEDGPWPFASAAFDAVIVTNYLHRARFDALLDALGANGVLIYETFMAGNETLGKPSNPDFLLQPGELLERVGSRSTVLAFEQGRIARPKPAFVQRICAIAGAGRLLPELPSSAASAGAP